MSRLYLIIFVLLASVLSACSAIPIGEQLLGPDLQRKDWDAPSEVHKDLVSLPLPRGRIGASVYNFRDLTGQYKTSPASSFSTAVSQGAASMLIKAIKDSGWFTALEREGLQDLLTERKIIRAALKKQSDGAEVPPLLGANILFEGGIIGYETNMKTGGVGAKYFGVGMSEQYRVDQVTVNLRAVDVNTGRVINSVTTARSILSRAVQGGAFRFVRFKRLLEIEAGYTRNEPVQLCLLEAIQAAVMKIIVEGVEDNSWTLADTTQARHPLMLKYGSGIVVKQQVVKKREQQTPQVSKAVVSRSPKKISKAPSRVGRKSTAVKSTNNVALKKVNFVDPLVKNFKSPDVKVNAKRSIAGSQAMANNRDGNWVIQLISSASAMEILNFARKNKLDRDMVEYIHYQVKGKDRFAILYGKFHNKYRALKAIESLPPGLRVYEPWVRVKSGVS